MFYGKKIKAIEERLSKAEQFEKGVCTVIDNYFATNEKKELKFSTDCVCDKFYHFVKSVDDKLKRLGKIEEQNKVLKAENLELKDEIQSDNEELASKDERIDELTAVVREQDKEIQELRKTKTETAKGGKK